MEFDFPRRPGGKLDELWTACIRLLSQIAAKPVVLHGVAVGTSETPIAHGLKSAPLASVPVPMANVSVWKTKESDERYIYLQAASATTINVVVFQ